LTKALREAFREAQKLSDERQDQLAAAIRAEIDADLAWESRLAGSPEALEALAEEALAEHKAGRTRPLLPEDE
jgi:hypothetical protein